jgi:hypothetical protein
MKILSFNEFLFEAQDSGELRIPGDPYTYKLINGVWHTKGQKIKDWKSLANDKEALVILNKQFPNLVKQDSTKFNWTMATPGSASGSVVGAMKGNDPLQKIAKRLTTPQTEQSSPNSGYIMVFAFPDYQPTIEDTWMSRNVYGPITNWIYDNEEFSFAEFEEINEEEVKQGSTGDPYEYKKDGEKYYTRKKGSKGQWISLTGKSAEAIKTKIFGLSIPNIPGKSSLGKSSVGGSSVGGSGSGDGKSKMIKLGKLGHGGCIVIKKDGNATLYEFGRYKSNNKGNVVKVKLGKIAKIVDGKLTNPKQVATIAKSKTQGQGPKLAMDVVIKELPNPDKAIAFADVTERDYALADPGKGGAMNCGTYALETAIEGGVNADFVCFASPIEVVDSLEPGISLPDAPMGTLTV